ncbi:MAG: 1-acyl-sn-glycerol-3-phosphate acyltransferase [Mesoaciditoga sp.]|uniref:lysophospholipid acyltransferase family protein n=3 Tax=Athalassotoga sp. TaxID=2022597 RepID=UPI000CA98597|nr:MAG: 1-acyl-sn-glycerol-3-phosphate acyltransferase [Mesoaciditoga sp.]HEU25186.1 1-acyl-sn-glycerol-3-phosphate acyltransferase [Mesoaciditoga lauensis]
MGIIRYIFTMIAFLFYMAYAPFFVKGVKKRSGIEKEEYINLHVGRWGRRSFSFPGSKVHIFGKENIPPKGPYIIVANHRSMLDITLIQGYVNPHTGFIAKKELGNFFTVGKFLKILGGELIDRENPRDAVYAIENIIKRMHEEGQIIAIFPEGTRSTDRKIHEFKVGSMKIITKARVPILPVVISGTERSMPKGSMYIKRADIYLSIMPVIKFEEIEKMTSKEIADFLKDKMTVELQRIEGGELNERSKSQRVGI